MKLLLELLRVWCVSFKAAFQLSYGVYRLSKLTQPIVAVFGGKGAYYKGKYAKWAYQFSEKIIDHNMSVITGGGPGIMEAANCGAFESSEKKKEVTLGIRVKGVDATFLNKCASFIKVDYFFVRKWLLTHYACGFVHFPGGIGTVDELFEVLNLMKVKKVKKVPIILVGTDYWKNLIEWYEHALKSDLIDAPLQSMLVITDDIDEAVHAIVSSF